MKFKWNDRFGALIFAKQMVLKRGVSVYHAAQRTLYNDCGNYCENPDFITNRSLKLFMNEIENDVRLSK